MRLPFSRTGAASSCEPGGARAGAGPLGGGGRTFGKVTFDLSSIHDKKRD